MTAIRDAIRNATQDNVITQEEWAGIKTLASETPLMASEGARDLVSVFANDQFEFQGAVKNELRTVLRDRGYDVPTARPSGTSNAAFEEKIISSNVSETDQAFASMQERAGLKDATVSVGVLDTGLDVTHAALQDNLWINEGEIAGDGIDNDGNGYIDDVNGFDFNTGKGVIADDEGAADPSQVEGWRDDSQGLLKDSHGHGTHVSGIITKGTDSVDVMGLTVIAGRNFSGKLVGEAIDYAAANGAKVLNMSFKVTNQQDVADILAAMARHPEVMFVASAGNDGRDINSYKAEQYLKKNTLDNFLVVSSADPEGTRSSFSNFGQPWATHADTGRNVLSTTPNGKFSSMSGTSMASPNAGAAAAKAMLMDPGLSPAQVKNLLADVTPKDDHWLNLVNAGGRIDARAAYTVAGVTGLVRREGLSLECAAQKLGLTDAEMARILPIAEKYAPAAPGSAAAA